MENEKEVLQEQAAAEETPETPVTQETPVNAAEEKPGRGKWFGKGKKKKEKVKKTVGQEILSWIFTILAALAIAFVIRTFVFEFVKVDGESMDDTLANGDIMFVSKLSYGSRWLAMPWANAETQENSAKWTFFGSPERFDVVICRYPSRGGTNFVKRVVGLPGDTVQIIDGYLYVNGEKVDEPYINDGYRVGSGYRTDLRRVPAKGDQLVISEEKTLIGYSGTSRIVLPVFSVNGETSDHAPTPYGMNSEFTATCGEDTLTQAATRHRDSGAILRISFIYNGKTLTTDGTTWYLDGEAQESNPLSGKTFTVTEDRYYLMGDHRDNSNDSRQVGVVPRSYIIGKVKQVILPFGHWKGIPNGRDANK